MWNERPIHFMLTTLSPIKYTINLLYFSLTRRRQVYRSNTVTRLRFYHQLQFCQLIYSWLPTPNLYWMYYYKFFFVSRNCRKTIEIEEQFSKYRYNKFLYLLHKVYFVSVLNHIILETVAYFVILCRFLHFRKEGNTRVENM